MEVMGVVLRELIVPTQTPLALPVLEDIDLMSMGIVLILDVAYRSHPPKKHARNVIQTIPLALLAPLLLASSAPPAVPG